MTTLQIRPARAAEAEAIADLHTASWRVTYPGILPDDTTTPEFIATRRAWWRQALAREDWTVILVAEAAGAAADAPQDKDNALLGFVAAWADPEGHVDAFIESLHVRPGRTRGGIGRALVGAAAARFAAAGRRSVALWVYDANTRARRFYASIGGTVALTRDRDRAGHPVRDLRITWPDSAALAALCAPSGADR
jgi:ribosomal protein S18 acetylase RimI-like enzyme